VVVVEAAGIERFLQIRDLRAQPGPGQVRAHREEVGRQEEGEERHRPWQRLLGACSWGGRRRGREDEHPLGRTLPTPCPTPGRKKALVAVAAAWWVIVWHLSSDRQAQFVDLGPDFHDRHVSTQRVIRSHVRQLEVLGYRVSIQPAA